MILFSFLFANFVQIIDLSLIDILKEGLNNSSLFTLM